MFWVPDHRYAGHGGQPVTGRDLVRVADLFRFVAAEQALSWPAAEAFSRLVVPALGDDGELSRFWEWAGVVDAVIADGEAGASVEELRLRSYDLIENPPVHITDQFCAGLMTKSQNILAAGTVDLTEYAASAFSARTLHVATAITLGWTKWDAWQPIPTLSDIGEASALLAGSWSDLAPTQSYVASAPVWDNATFGRDKAWWDDYVYCFWHVHPHRRLAELMIPGFQALSEKKRAKETVRTQSSAAFTQTAINSMISNSNKLIEARKFDTRTIYGHPGMTTY